MLATPKSERLRIGIFGRRNAGKSSLINSLTAQETALVSSTAGTTTDPVSKAMEILPIGPVLIVDTAGLDDTGELGEQRIRRSKEVLPGCDLALVVISSRIENNFTLERSLLEEIRSRKIPAIAVITHCDIQPPSEELSATFSLDLSLPTVRVSNLNGSGVEQLKKLIIANSDSGQEMKIVGDLLSPGETAVLVVPIDDAAPKGRLILPQVQSIRDLLDSDAMALVVKERELAAALNTLAAPPALVVTDSQAFQKVAADTPLDIPLTSFSILFARYKGDLEAYIEGIKKIDSLKDGDRILIAEACTHHVQSDDIGTVKIPRWLRESTGLRLDFEKTAGNSFPRNLSEYALVIHCGGCMLNRRTALNRISIAREHHVPITNYGMVIAHTFGILKRALAPFPVASAIFNDDPY